MSGRAARAAPAIVAPSVWPDTMGLEDAADYLRLGRDATRQLFDDGLLPGTSLNQKHLVFRRASLDAFLAKMELEQQVSRLARKLPSPANGADSSRRGRKKKVKPDLSQYEAG